MPRIDHGKDEFQLSERVDGGQYSQALSLWAFGGMKQPIASRQNVPKSNSDWDVLTQDP